jgi:hypothetical protein
VQNRFLVGERRTEDGHGQGAADVPAGVGHAANAANMRV